MKFYFSANDTPLHYAIRSGKENAVRFLLRLGADMEICGKDGNALQIAIKDNRHGLLSILNAS